MEENTRVQNDLVITQVNTTVVENTQEILEDCVNWDSFSQVCEDVTAAIISDLDNGSFMSEDLRLTEKQKELLKKDISGIVDNAKNVYKGKLESDKRTKELVASIKSRLKDTLEKLLASIGREVNRGAVINAVAVSADTKNLDSNKIELRHSKHSGDITIPTRGVFLSTNCVEIIKNSIELAEIAPKQVQGVEIAKKDEESENN